MNEHAKEVSPGIFVIEETGLSKVYKPPVNVYVITGSDGIVFDAGYGNRGAVKQFSRGMAQIRSVCAIRGAENNISRILISHAHPDHFAGLKKLSAKHDLETVVTVRMAEIIKSRQAYRNSFAYNEPFKRTPGFFRRKIKRFLERINYRIYAKSWGIEFLSSPDIIIEDNCSMTINGREWRIFLSPGHSDDHISLYNPETGILFGGDNILRSKFTWLGPPRSDIDLYLESLRYIMGLPGLVMILPAHGSVITEPAGRIMQIISYWENRMKQVGVCMAESGVNGITLREIITKLYPGSGRVKHEFVRGWIMLVLDKFIRDGMVYAENGRYYSVPGETC